MIRDQNQRAGFVRAAEFADYELPEIPHITQIAPTLCFTRQQVQFLRPHNTSSKPVFSLPANTLAGKQIVGLSIGEARLLPQNAGLLPEHENSLVDLAVKVVKFSKLLPTHSISFSVNFSRCIESNSFKIKSDNSISANFFSSTSV